MRIGLFFGSFNPVHSGHLILAAHFTNENIVDECWFIISPQNPFKEKKSLLNEQHRLNLVRAALEGETKIKASNIEFSLPRPSYTVDTLLYLREKYPQHEFYILMGSDGLANFPRWKNYEQILEMAGIFVYPRPGHTAETFTHKGIQVVEAPLIEISSTRIRKLIRAHKNYRYLVPDLVKEIIDREGYYLSSLENEAQ
ncbi:MAG: nicotinate (nicotinamide) nucleotide adenylyltransferase [Ferruginibacter sp.]